MKQEIIQSLQAWAEKYNTKEFIEKDPIQFPHRFTDKRDIEISAFLTAWISFGRRSHILAKAEEMHELMNQQPHTFIREAQFAEIHRRAECEGSRNTFYRFYTYADLFILCKRLHHIYTEYESMEDALIAMYSESSIRKLQMLFASIKGIPVLDSTSACKRLAMFLRWMVRRDGIVDFGIWKHLSPAELIIPLDTHVFQISRTLGLTTRKTADWKTATEITENLKTIFPEDPCLGDFALFGYDVTNS